MLQYTIIDNKKVIAHPDLLERLLAAKKMLELAGLQLLLAPESTASWRSLKDQQALVNKGASKTLYSNHRRGTAIDVKADWDYINKIAPIMKSHGLINDLAFVSKDWTKIDDTKDAETPIPWDGGHFNLISNAHAATYPIIDSIDNNSLTEFTMTQEYENCLIQETEKSGSFALVIDGKKRVIAPERSGQAALTCMMRGISLQQGNAKHVNKAVWDSIPTGQAF